MLSKSQICFRACFLPVQAKDLSAPRYIKMNDSEIFWTINKLWKVHTTEDFWHILSSAWLPQKPWDLHKESYCACVCHFSLEFLFQIFYPFNTCIASYSQNVCSHVSRSSWKVLLLLNKCILNLDVLKKFDQLPPTPNFMKIQPPFPDCDMQMGGHTDKEKIASTFLQLFIATDQKSSAVPKYQVAVMWHDFVASHYKLKAATS